MPDLPIDYMADEPVCAEALAGLSQTQKTLPPKLFYDQEGCRLFRTITELPEYYLTRAERALLEIAAPGVAAAVTSGAVLVEYGASDESKAELLLRERVFAAYMPIDVASQGLEQARRRLRRSHPELRVHPLTADFMRPVALPPVFDGLPRLGFFPGSTIGNLTPTESHRFLMQVRRTLGPGAQFLIGADLRKDPEFLIAAYDDEAGVTAAFNLNLLTRLNREAGADFDLAAFRHRAVWNEIESRIEMHLVSRCDQVAYVAGRSIRFARNETIHTENSYKYSLQGFATLAGEAGWRSRRTWTDENCLFSIHLLVSD